ncbi:hypothetical protein SLS62_000319 [Diatrype stigma]|uniref:DUF423-domain-containing protein n=1 Tax=Diatrype stigma TaxID=117547 RepID=A0AAN9YUZ0_9PEZI
MSDERAPLLPENTTSNNTTVAGTSTRSSRRTNMFWTVGALYGASAVCLGAFGAHGLKKSISDPARIANWGTAAQYQATLLVAAQAAPENKVAGGLFTAGMTMFSGSIYALVLDPARFRFLGPVTPIGGLCLIGGWVALAFQ